MSLYERAVELPALGFPVAAVDTETTRWTDAQFDALKRTRLSPQGPVDLVLGSIARDQTVSVLRGPDLVARVEETLEAGEHLVFHNLPFDYRVLCRAAPHLRALLHKAIEEGRLHDTQILAQLVTIAKGSQTVDAKVLKLVSLKELAARRAGIDLDKAHDIRVNFEQFLDPAVPIPEEYLVYAARDAEATHKVHWSLHREAELLADVPNCRYPLFPSARERFGLLSETVQVKGSIALRWLEDYPLRVDLTRLEEIRKSFDAECRRLEDALVSFKWAKRGPKNGKFSLSHKTLRRVFGDYARERAFTPLYSTTGLVGLTYEFWKDYIKQGAPKLLAEPSGAVTVEEQAAVWLRYHQLRKILTTYLNVYCNGPSHFASYYNLGARTGRVSCVRPNAQQVPKHGEVGELVRSLFVAPAGRVIVEADFKSAELVALAQIYHVMFGGSHLETSINADLDVLADGAALTFKSEWATCTPDRRKLLRQIYKLGAYGIPGGLGRKSFARKLNAKAGTRLSDEEAGALRHAIINADPALHTYLAEGNQMELLRRAASNLNTTFEDLITRLQAWRDEEAGEIHLRLAFTRLRAWATGADRFEIPEPPGFRRAWDLFVEPTRTLTGRVRGRATFGAAHNTPFQGLVADGFKLSLWRLYKAWCDDPFFEPVAGIHDSVLISCRLEDAARAKALLNDCMVQGLSEVCPDIAVRVGITGPMTRWSGELESAA